MKGMGNDLIREARRRRGMTQAQLAERLGTTQSAIARLERGTTAPSFDRVVEILRALDLDLDFMLVERDESDWLLAAANLKLSPAELSERHEKSTAFFRSVQGLASDAVETSHAA